MGVVIITMGGRNPQLIALLDSVLAQKGTPATTVVLGQGAQLPELPVGVHGVELPENLGIPGGREAGARWLREQADSDVIIFLDDDGRLPDDDAFEQLRRHFAGDPRLGIIGFRIVDEHGQTARRHVPRLRGADPARSGPVTTFLGGAHAIRQTVIDQVGGFPGPFHYAHEETDFAWRALDDGWSIQYRADLRFEHPRTNPARHALYFRLTGRNRVWLAKRRLPAALIPVYLTAWALYTLVLRPPRAGLAAWWSGFFEGIRTSCPPRAPMRWRTVWRMTRLGRPPIL